MTLLAQVQHEDWKIGGYANENQWIIHAKPAGSATETRNLLTFWRRVYPLIEAAGFEVPQIVNNLCRSSVAELIAICGKPGVDARMVKVICQWIVDGSLTDVMDFRSLKSSPALISASKVMDLLTDAGINPVESYLTLSEGQEFVADKLHPIAQMLTSVGMAKASLPTFIDQMHKLGPTRVAEYCGIAKTADPSTRQREKEIDAAIATEEPGDTAPHEIMDIQVAELPGGYYTTTMSRRQLQEIWSQVKGMRIFLHGQEVKF